MQIMLGCTLPVERKIIIQLCRRRCVDRQPQPQQQRRFHSLLQLHLTLIMVIVFELLYLTTWVKDIVGEAQVVGHT